MALEPGVFPEVRTVSGLPRGADELSRRQPFSRPPMSAQAIPVSEAPQAAPSATARFREAAGRLLFNAFPFGVVAAFFWLQALIDRQAHGTALQVEMGAAALVEVGLVFVWSLFLD